MNAFSYVATPSPSKAALPGAPINNGRSVTENASGNSLRPSEFVRNDALRYSEPPLSAANQMADQPARDLRGEQHRDNVPS